MLPPPQLPPPPVVNGYFEPQPPQLPVVDWSAHYDARARAAYLLEQQQQCVVPAATLASLGGDVSMANSGAECKVLFFLTLHVVVGAFLTLYIGCVQMRARARAVKSEHGIKSEHGGMASSIRR